MDIQLIRNLLIKILIDGNYSICDTCIHHDKGKTCRYNDKGKCTDGLEEYVPDRELINS